VWKPSAFLGASCPPNQRRYIKPDRALGADRLASRWPPGMVGAGAQRGAFPTPLRACRSSHAWDIYVRPARAGVPALGDAGQVSRRFSRCQPGREIQRAFEQSGIAMPPARRSGCAPRSWRRRADGGSTGNQRCDHPDRLVWKSVLREMIRLKSKPALARAG